MSYYRYENNFCLVQFLDHSLRTTTLSLGTYWNFSKPSVGILNKLSSDCCKPQVNLISSFENVDFALLKGDQPVSHSFTWKQIFRSSDPPIPSVFLPSLFCFEQPAFEIRNNNQIVLFVLKLVYLFYYFKYILLICYYSCPIFSPLYPSLSAPPPTSIPPLSILCLPIMLLIPCTFYPFYPPSLPHWQPSM